MIVAVTFLLGVANFALHQAVRQSGHPLLGRMPWFYHMLGGRFSLVVEFLVLLAALLFAAQGSRAAALAYIVYTALNALGGWLIITRRI